MKPKIILIPLPSYGFDPSEAAVFWKILNKKGYEIVFSTPNGDTAKADSLMLSGKNLGIFKPILRAGKDAVIAHDEMIQDESFCNPIRYSDLREQDFDAIYLPGGHDKAVKEYLESSILKKIIVEFFHNQKPVAAVCHGVVLVARSIDWKTKKSVLYNFKTTALLKFQELSAYKMTKFWLKDYYLTYPGITVEDEVKSSLCDQKNFIHGPKPLFRDSEKKLSRGFYVKDKNYLSARWPGDIYAFSNQFIEILESKH